MAHQHTPEGNEMKLFEMVNTATEEVEAIQEMTPREAERRNARLRHNGEPQRWVISRDPLWD